VFSIRMHPSTLGLGLLAALAAAPARAHARTADASTLQVVAPLHVPGAVLEPGVYTLRVVEERADRNIIRITDARGRICAIAAATPDVVPRARSDSEFVIDVDAKGRPMALRSWWAPHDRTGEDFVYARDEEAEFARRAVTSSADPSASAPSGGSKSVGSGP